MRSLVTIAALGVTLAMAATSAKALAVREGCATPPPIEAAHRSFYVDPQRGSPRNDGSVAHPWRTLAEVLDPASHLIATRTRVPAASGDRFIPLDPDAPIKSGDVIYLMSGDHGMPVAESWYNEGFITIEAAPGQKPSLGPTRIGGSHWILRGLTFEGLAGAAAGRNALVAIGGDGAHPGDNIILDGDTFDSQADVGAWTGEDWVKKPFNYALEAHAACSTLANNHFFNVRNAVVIDSSAANSTVEQNLIENFGNDGVDFVASHVTIRGNVIRDGRHTWSELLHPDGIQGWTERGAVNRDVTIDSNTVINTPDFGDTLQGISIFDGRWSQLVVCNNVVVTNTWHGIALYGVEDALVVNNTIVPSDPTRHPTWIIIHAGKDGAPSRNVVVRNNIASQLFMAGEELFVDHNVVQKRIELPESRGPAYCHHGFVGYSNFVDPQIFRKLTRVDDLNGQYDLRRRPDVALILAGNADRAPAFDIEGKPRREPIEIGAYAR